ncbi:MAG TPA: ABC transporter substrate-binding protein [Candidatus Atribacteria bacterium]|nr:ABC transporter substrate-binding protein [Candidatus Atribacteria bacterium]
MKTLRMVTAGMIAAACLIVAGCAPQGRQADMSLKIGLMPAVDAATFLLAEKKGYFEEQGLDVELILFNSGQDRQSALQTNAVDGVMTDLIAIATNVDGGFDIKATTMTNGVFPVLIKPGSEAKQAVKVGMMEVSVTNFLIDQWLGDKYKIEKVYINDIPTRLAAIVSGELDMGSFPEPVASMGVLQGLEKKNYEYEDGNCPDVMAFTGTALKNKDKAIELFHKAYNKAIEDINSNDSEARDILLEKIPNLNPAIKDDIIMPEFTPCKLQDDDYIRQIIEWTEKVMNKDMNVEPEDLVERKYVD